MGLPKGGPAFVQQVYALHGMYDMPGISSAALAAGNGFSAGGDGIVGGPGFADNLLGHRSGVSSATLWAPAPARPQPTQYSDWGSGGPVTYGATSLVDTGKGWGVGDADIGATVTYGAATVTDTARNNASGWVVGNTAQYAGQVIITATGKSGIIASAAAGVLTLTANWVGGTPAAGEAYRINGGQVGRRVTSVAAGNVTFATVVYHINQTLTLTAWSNGTPGAGAVYVLAPPPVPAYPQGTRTGAQASDNWFQAQAQFGNTEVE